MKSAENIVILDVAFEKTSKTSPARAKMSTSGVLLGLPGARGCKDSTTRHLLHVEQAGLSSSS